MRTRWQRTFYCTCGLSLTGWFESETEERLGWEMFDAHSAVKAGQHEPCKREVAMAARRHKRKEVTA